MWFTGRWFRFAGISSIRCVLVSALQFTWCSIHCVSSVLHSIALNNYRCVHYEEIIYRPVHGELSYPVDLQAALYNADFEPLYYKCKFSILSVSSRIMKKNGVITRTKVVRNIKTHAHIYCVCVCVYNNYNKREIWKKGSILLFLRRTSRFIIDVSCNYWVLLFS
jgi:hypothetical protein